MAQADELLHLRRDHDNGAALFGKPSNEPVNLLLVADIDAAGRLVDDHDPGLGQHHLGKQQLLLVAAGQFAREHIATACPDVEITNGCIKRCILAPTSMKEPRVN